MLIDGREEIPTEFCQIVDDDIQLATPEDVRKLCAAVEGHVEDSHPPLTTNARV